MQFHTHIQHPYPKSNKNKAIPIQISVHKFQSMQNFYKIRRDSGMPKGCRKNKEQKCDYAEDNISAFYVKNFEGVDK